MSEIIKSLWEEVPENAVKINDEFLSYIPLYPKCISAQNLREFLGIKKSTLSYHIRKYKESIIIFVVKKKHYYQRKDENE